jgi:glycosyltransferase involved in cell wall biosynthesis
MHVVQVLAALSVGGSELVVAELSEYLRGLGHEVTVIGRKGPLSERVEQSGAKLLDWPVGKKRFSTLRYIRQFADWITEHRPDVVHVHSRLPAWICRLALRKVDPAIRPHFVTSMHGQYTVSAYSAVMARGDKVIAVSDHIRDFTLEHYDFVDQRNIVTIHGGVSRKAFPFGFRPDDDWYRSIWAEFPELRHKRLLLLPARLSRYKGHAAFIELIASLSAQHPDLHGVILGPGRPGSRYRAELEGIAQREHVLDRITFTGLRSDVRDWMAASDIVFNLCSDPPEAFGRTVPEALRLGIPVIAWNHGGVRETLAGMFPEGAVKPDSFKELLVTTRTFLETPRQVKESDTFLLSDSLQRTLAVYTSIV